MTEHHVLDAATREAIVAAYQRGDKVASIQKAFNVPRATIYWALEKAEVTPDRVKRGVRLSADHQQVAQLYELIEAQAARIAELENLLGDLGKRS